MNNKINRILIESEKDSNKTLVISVKQTAEKANEFAKEFMSILQDGFKLFIEEVELNDTQTNE